jgi:hypothetical protein
VDAEFINVYIAKQKAWIEDLLAKHIILESRLGILEKSVSEKGSEIESLRNALEEKNQHINKLVDTNNRKIAEINNLVVEKEQQKLKASKKKKTDPVEIHISADEF